MHSSKEVTRSVARQAQYELAFGTPNRDASSSTILSPYYFPGAFKSITSSLKNQGISTISLDNATSLLYSDFSRKNPYGGIYFNRRDTVQILEEGFKQLNDEGIKIMAQSANAYALPYVSHISNIPLSSSNYDLFDYDIPFYQIVIQGLVPHSTTPFNASSDMKALVLLSLATGTPAHYEFMYENAGEFNDSQYDKKFYSSFEGWAERTAEMYKLFDDVIGDVISTKITAHERLGVNEYQTVFEGGKTIYINLDTYELKVDGVTYDWGGGA
jgi:hypothetical protein